MKLVLVVVEKNIKNVVQIKMKLWIADTNLPTHRLVKLNSEPHSDYVYAGEFDDDKLKDFFLELDPKMNLEKNMQLIKYYGYLHLFIVKSALDTQGKKER